MKSLQRKIFKVPEASTGQETAATSPAGVFFQTMSPVFCSGQISWGSKTLKQMCLHDNFSVCFWIEKKRFYLLIELETLTRASLLIAALLLSGFTGARFSSEERPLTDPLSLLDASTTGLAAASP